MMTKQVYIKVAEVLKKLYRTSLLSDTKVMTETVVASIDSFEDMFKNDNPRFDLTRFRQAVYNP